MKKYFFRGKYFLGKSTTFGEKLLLLEKSTFSEESTTFGAKVHSWAKYFFGESTFWGKVHSLEKYFSSKSTLLVLKSTFSKFSCKIFVLLTSFVVNLCIISNFGELNVTDVKYSGDQFEDVGYIHVSYSHYTQSWKWSGI